MDTAIEPETPSWHIQHQSIINPARIQKSPKIKISKAAQNSRQKTYHLTVWEMSSAAILWIAFGGNAILIKIVYAATATRGKPSFLPIDTDRLFFNSSFFYSRRDRIFRLEKCPSWVYSRESKLNNLGLVRKRIKKYLNVVSWDSSAFIWDEVTCGLLEFGCLIEFINFELYMKNHPFEVKIIIIVS